MNTLWYRSSEKSPNEAYLPNHIFCDTSAHRVPCHHDKRDRGRSQQLGQAQPSGCFRRTLSSALRGIRILADQDEGDALDGFCSTDRTGPVLHPRTGLFMAGYRR